MNSRRSFVNRLCVAFGVVLGTAIGQNAIMENGKAVSCKGSDTTCPNGHKTCATIDAPLAIGNDSYDYPEVRQLRDYHVLRCDYAI